MAQSGRLGLADFGEGWGWPNNSPVCTYMAALLLICFLIEICFAASWMWCQLRKTRSKGFFL